MTRKTSLPGLHWDAMTRRHFFRSAAGLIVALPALSSLLEKEARAAVAKRFVFLHNGHGQIPAQWFPNPAAYTFSVAEADYRAARLTEIMGPISPIFDDAFSRFKAKLTLISRLDYSNDNPNHNCEAVLSGGTLGSAGAENTLDHVMARLLGGGSPLTLTAFSPFSEGQSNRFISVKNGEFVTGRPKPSAVFAELFPLAGSGPTMPGAPAGQSSAELLARKKAVDHVFAQYKELRAQPRLSGIDKARLDEHMQLLSELQGRLDPAAAGGAGGGASCSAVAAMAESPVPSTKTNELDKSRDYDVILTQSIDLLAMAVKCGRTKVATLQMHPYDYFAGHVHFLFPGETGLPLFHEGFGHCNGAALQPGRLKIQKYFASKFLRLLESLDEMEDSVSGSTYLDNSIVLWGNDIGAADIPEAHARKNLPIVLAGSGGGSLRSGYYIDFGPGNAQPKYIDANSNPDGKPINQLLISILLSMGITADRYESTPGSGFGVYGQRHPLSAATRSPLPFLTL